MILDVSKYLILMWQAVAVLHITFVVIDIMKIVTSLDQDPKNDQNLKV